MNESNFTPADKLIKIRSDVRKVMDIIRRKGILDALTITKATTLYRFSAWEGYRFDSKYHVETSLPAYLSDLSTSSDDEIGVNYVASSPLVVRAAIDQVPLPPKELVFIDIGCGKGRVALIAAERGFKHTVGVEIADELFKSALKNVKNYKKATGRNYSIDIIKCDATKYSFPNGNCVLYYFGAPLRSENVLNRTIGNAYKSYKEIPREMYLILLNVHRDDLQQAFPFLKKVQRFGSVNAWICSKLFSLNVYKFSSGG